MTRAKYLADLLALQVLNSDVAHHINRGDCDALADYFVDDAKYEEDTQTSKGRDAIIAWFRARSQAPQAPTRHSCSAVRVVIVDPKSARGSRLRVSYVGRRSPHDPALACPLESTTSMTSISSGLTGGGELPDEQKNPCTGKNSAVRRSPASCSQARFRSIRSKTAGTAHAASAKTGPGSKGV
jgi:hypothetical protein